MSVTIGWDMKRWRHKVIAYRHRHRHRHRHLVDLAQHPTISSGKQCHLKSAFIAEGNAKSQNDKTKAKVPNVNVIANNIHPENGEEFGDLRRRLPQI